ncbi:MAG: 5,6-dimethylbenzimidazole synthase [Pseudomonadota bacterium]
MTHTVGDAPSEFDVFQELVARRRDVRRFRTDQIDERVLDEIFRLVELAPSVGNSQPWKWIKVEDHTLRKEIRANFEIANLQARSAISDDKKELYDSLKLAGLKEAPVQFAVFCDCSTTKGGGLGRQSMPETLHYSVVCAIMTFWLAAKAKGIGVGWVSILDPSPINAILDVPNEWDLVAYLCVGYPMEVHYDAELERLGWQERTWSRNEVLRR